MLSRDVTGCNMWDAEPTLYWRVKRGDKWVYERARFAHVDRNLIAIEWPKPPQDEEE